MTLSTGQRSLLAVALVVSMLLAGFPMVAGDDAPDLSKVESTRIEEGDCLTLSLPSDQAEALVADLRNLTEDPESAAGLAPDPSDLGSDPAAEGNVTVPVVCGEDADQVFRALIQAGNTALSTLESGLDELRSTSQENQPVGTLTFLGEEFSVPRIGGLGPWQVRTAGDKTGFREPVDPRVTEGYALTDTPDGTYEHGLNTTLVSPAIDLGGVATDPALARFPSQALELLKSRLPDRAPLTPGGDEEGTTLDVCIFSIQVFGFSSGGQCLYQPNAGAVEEAYGEVRQAYLAAADSLLRAYQEELASATLEIRHRFNLAEGLDGVRLEVLTDPPPVSGLPPVGTPLVPRSDSEGTGHEDVAAFNGREGFTGTSEGWVTERFDLTPWTGERIWILVRARTTSATGIESFFSDPVLFPDQDGYGYGIGALYANGTAHRNNLRVLAIDMGQAQIDGKSIAPPPQGAEPVTISVTNQGLEPARATLRLAQCQGSQCPAHTWLEDARAGASQDRCSGCPSDNLGTLELAPGEVRQVRAPLVDSLDLGRVARLSANLSHTDDTREATPEDNELAVAFDVKTVRRLTVLPERSGSLGLSISHQGGDVAEPRTVQLRVRNDGNVPISETIGLEVQDVETGATRPSFLGAAATRTLDLPVGAVKTLAWQVTPGEAGVYRVTASTSRIAFSGIPAPTVHLFAERSPGVACADNLDAIRACGALWQRGPEVPQDARFIAVAPAPDGELYGMDRSGEILRFDGNAWEPVTREPGTPARADWLVTTSGGVLVVSSTGETGLLDGGTLAPGASAPLNRVVDVAVRPTGQAVLAGHQGGDLGVAIGDGKLWQLETSPRVSITSQDIEVAGVTVLDEGPILLALREEVEAEDATYVRVCQVAPSVQDDSLSCFATERQETGATEPRITNRLVEAPLTLGDREPAIQLGRVANWTVLAVESPVTDGVEPKGRCEQDRHDAGAGATPGVYCFYRLSLDNGTRNAPFTSFAVRPSTPTFTTVEPADDDETLALVTVGGVTWILDRAPVKDGTGEPAEHPDGTLLGPENGLHRIALGKSGHPAVHAASVPGDETLTTIGGGHTRATALAETSLMELSGQAPHLETRGDWRQTQVLHAQTPHPIVRAWTTVDDVVSGSLATSEPEAFTRFEGAQDDFVLRGTCFGAAATTPCVRITDPQEPRRVDLTLRYNLQERGVAPAEIRVLLAGYPATIKAVSGNDADPEGPVDPGSLAASLFVTLQDRLNRQLTGEDSAQKSAERQLFGQSSGDGPVRGNVGEEESVRRATGSQPQRSPHVVVHQIDQPTGDGWHEIEFDLREALETYVRAQGIVGVMGVEITFPEGSRMALDALWLNATFREPGSAELAEPETLLSTQGYAQNHMPGTKGVWIHESTGFDEPRPPSLRTAYTNRGASQLVREVWRSSEISHRPAWSFMAPADHPGQAAPYSWGKAGNPRENLHNAYDRLVTPAIDLRQAKAPVLTFQHAYAFLPHVDNTKHSVIRSAGWVEAQVETSPGQWSQWFKLRPEGGYPLWETSKGEFDVDAYTGSLVPQDRDRGRSGILDTDNWVEERFNLIDQTVPMNDKRVRLGFVGYLAKPPFVGKVFEPHEGWVVSDLRLISETPPARDLAIKDVAFEEPYDVWATGLPPGETVRLNATLVNGGRVESTGGSLRWEMVAIGREDRVVARGSTPLASMDPGRTTSVELPVRVPVSSPIPGLPLEETRVFFRVVLEPGTEPDEDPTNNVFTLADRTDPLPIQATRDLRVQIEVVPTQGSPDRVRAIDVRLHNLGNVPLDGLEVDRSVAQERGVLGRQAVAGETLTTETTRPLGPGQVRTLSQLVDGFDLQDRFWMPGDDGTYTVQVTARGHEVSDSAEVSAVALAPYLSSSVEDPVTGLSVSGDFQPREGWAVDGPGAFGSSRAFHLQPDTVGITEEGREFVLDFPRIDLSVAKQAEASFYHRYLFEEGFDGGRLEASLDGGETWQPVPTVSRGEKTGYAEILGGNPMARGNLTIDAFSGNSSGHGLDGWVLSRFDLGALPGFTEPGEIEAFDFESMSGGSTRPVTAPPSVEGPDTVYTHPTWARGSIAASRAFLVENVTENIQDRGPPGFLYTGPAQRIEDLGKNIGARMTVDLPIDEDDVVEGDRRVVISWREWAPLNQDGQETPHEPFGPTEIRDRATTLEGLYWNRGVFTTPASSGPASGGPFVCHEPRFLIQLTGIEGYWRSYQVDVTDAVPEGEVTLDFSWAPWRHPAGFQLNQEDHPGMVVDDLRIRSFVEHPSGEVDVQREELNLDDADRFAFDSTAASPIPACDNRDQDGVPQDVLEHTDEVEAPRASWHVVDVSELARDRELYRDRSMVLSSSPLAGERPGVFDGRASDSRITLPALDLASAGDNVTLAFDHLPAFTYQSGAATHGGGGVVEVSVWDPVEGAWGPWDQLYSKPEQLNDFELIPNPGDATGQVYKHNVTGGYGAFVHVVGELPHLNSSNQADLALGTSHVQSMTFETHPGDPQQGDDGDLGWGPGLAASNAAFSRVSYVYNQCASLIQKKMMDGATVSPGQHCDWSGSRTGTDLRWWNASYDLSRFEGQRIRIGLHAYHTGACSFERGYQPHVDAVDAPGIELVGDAEPTRPGVQSYKRGCPDDGARWLVDDVLVQGLAFAGDKVDLRLVAGLDGSVHKAEWAVDELEVQGTAYRKNVGVYLDEDLPTELAPGTTLQITGELRNLGSQLRRGLALEVELEGEPVETRLSLEGVDAVEGARSVTSDTVTLAPGASAPFTLDIATEELDARGRVNLTVRVVQFNDVLGALTGVTGEEVRTNLERHRELEVTSPRLELTGLEALTNRVAPGGDIDVDVVLTNNAPNVQRIEVTCTAHRIQGWRPVEHGGQTTPEESPILGTAVPCQRLSEGAIQVASGTTRAPLRLTLPSDGAYLVKVEVLDVAQDAVVEEGQTIVWAGDAPVRMHESFENALGTNGADGQGWSEHRRGSPREPNQRSGYTQAATGGPTAREHRVGNFSFFLAHQPEAGLQARTPPIDLHNITEGGASLTFYHMARLAKGDGADVLVRVLEQESNPGGAGWTTWCKLEPIGGYGGYVASFHVNPDDQTAGGGQGLGLINQDSRTPASEPEGESSLTSDYNNALLVQEDNQTRTYRETGFFGTRMDPLLGEVPRWDEDWQLALFPLDADPETGDPILCEGQKLLGRHVQFAFTLYTGEADDAAQDGDTSDPYTRGDGEGWYIDSVAVTAARASIAPDRFQTIILDNATKRFPIRLDNQGAVSERGTLQVDFDRSTVARDQVRAGTVLAPPPNGSALGSVSVTLPRDPLALPFRHTIVAEVDGLLDPNVRPSTLLDLSFDPRVWPDLQAQVLDPSEPPVEGVPLVVPVQVTNHGLATAPSTDMVFRDTFGDATQEVEVQLPRIPAASEDPLAATTTVFVPWTPQRGTVGDHLIEVTLDPSHQLEEYTRQDNHVQRTLRVLPLLMPDLGFDEANLTVTSVGEEVTLDEKGTLRTYTATAGTLLTLGVPVLNTGNAPATNVDVRLSLGSVVLPAQRVSRLDPGEASQVSFTFLAQEGSREITLEASSSSRDLDPTDNRAPTVGAVRLVADSFRLEADTPETVNLEAAGTEAEAPVRLTNRGALGLLVDLVPRDTPGLTLELETNQVFLGAGETVTVPARLIASPEADGGDHVVTLTARAAERDQEALDLRIPVHLPVHHDLDVHLPSPTLGPGPGELQVTLENRGNLPESVDITPVLDGSPIGPATPVRVDRGTERAVQLSVDLAPQVAAGTGELTLQLAGTVEDQRVFEVQVEGRDRPVLSGAGEAAFTPKGLVMPLTLSNLGNLPFQGSVLVDGSNGLDRARVLPGEVDLAPGEAGQLELTVPAGQQATQARLLVNDAAGEQRLASSLALPGERPDTLLLRQQLTPQQATVGEPTELRVTVGNLGSVSARDVPVELFINGEFAARSTVADLAPGRSQTVTFDWPAFAGEHLATVAVDPGASVPDSDPENNRMSVLLQTTGDAGPLTQLTDGLREVPGPGGLSLLIAAGAALVVLGRWRRGPN